MTVTNLCKKDKRIPWGWCADVCQATKDWVKSTIMTKEAHVSPPPPPPAGWLDESPSSEMHEQVRLRCAFQAALMGPMVGDRSGRSGDTIVPIASLASAKVHIPAEKLGPSVHGRGPYAETQRERGPPRG